MKHCFLRLHLLNELSEPFIRQLVCYASHEGAVVTDLLVEFGALVTYGSFPVGANSSPDWLPAYIPTARNCDSLGIPKSAKL
jgi:hypothetical protein